MNVFYLAAATGLLSLAGGLFVVNVIATPRAAQIGTMIAAFGILLLAVVAVRQVFGQPPQGRLVLPLDVPCMASKALQPRGETERLTMFPVCSSIC